MIMIRKKNYSDYSYEKKFEFIFDKNEQKVYSPDVGILEVGKVYFFNFGQIVIDRFYCPNVCRVQYHEVGKKSPKYMDLSELIRLLWLTNLERNFV